MKKIVLFLVIISLYSCKNDSAHEQNIPIKTITVNEPDGLLDISKLKDKQKFLVLENCNDCRIAEVSRIHCYKGNLYIIDKLASTIWIFNDSTGKYVNQIHHPGEGPGEYSLLKDFWINEYDGTLEIYDRGKSAIMQFGFDGKFIDSYRIPIFFQAAYPVSSSEYFVYVGSNNTGRLQDVNLAYNGMIMNEKFDEVLFSVAPWMQVADTYKRNNAVSSNGDNLLFVTSFNDTVYQVQNSRIDPKYYIDFGNRKVPLKDILESPDVDNLQALVKENKYSYNLDNILESNEALYFTYSLSKEEFSYISPTVVFPSGKVCSGTGMTVSEFAVNLLGFAGTQDDYFISVIYANYPTEIFKDKVQGELKELSVGLQPHDNPILYFIKLKEPG